MQPCGSAPGFSVCSEPSAAAERWTDPRGDEHDGSPPAAAEAGCTHWVRQRLRSCATEWVKRAAELSQRLTCTRRDDGERRHLPSEPGVSGLEGGPVLSSAAAENEAGQIGRGEESADLTKRAPCLVPSNPNALLRMVADEISCRSPPLPNHNCPVRPSALHFTTTPTRRRYANEPLVVLTSPERTNLEGPVSHAATLKVGPVVVPFIMRPTCQRRSRVCRWVLVHRRHTDFAGLLWTTEGLLGGGGSLAQEDL